MNRDAGWIRLVLSLACVHLLAPDVVYSYGGPGGIVTGIGALIAVVGAILASIFGFLWFPLKRLLRRIRGQSEDPPEAGERPETEVGGRSSGRDPVTG